MSTAGVESLLRMALPVGLKFVMRFIFKAAKEYPNECEAARKDIDQKQRKNYVSIISG